MSLLFVLSLELNSKKYEELVGDDHGQDAHDDDDDDDE